MKLLMDECQNMRWILPTKLQNNRGKFTIPVGDEPRAGLAVAVLGSHAGQRHRCLSSLPVPIPSGSDTLSQLRCGSFQKVKQQPKRGALALRMTRRCSFAAASAVLPFLSFITLFPISHSRTELFALLE